MRRPGKGTRLSGAAAAVDGAAACVVSWVRTWASPSAGAGTASLVSGDDGAGTLGCPTLRPDGCGEGVAVAGGNGVASQRQRRR